MAVKRVVDTGYWIDNKVVEQFTPEDKYFFLYLLTNPHTTQLGVYAFSPKIAAFELGYSPDAVKSLLDRFESKHGIIKASELTGEIAIRNYLKHSIVKGGTPVRDLLLKEAAQVKDKELLQFVLKANADNANATVREFVQVAHSLYIYNIDNIDSIDISDELNNENDNDDSWPNRTTNRGRIVDESSNINKINESSHIRPTLEDVKAYCNERGNSVDAERFIDYYTANGWKVGRNPMKNWKAAVRTWEKNNYNSSNNSLMAPMKAEEHYDTHGEWR